MKNKNPGMKSGICEFDLIIVYSRGLVRGVKSRKSKNAPFSRKYDSYNDTYSYFLKSCRKAGIKAAFASSKDIVGPGLVRCFWTYEKRWKKNLYMAYSQVIFDKFRRNGKKSVLFSESVYGFNRKIARFFWDKLKTYKFFKDFSIPTMCIENVSRKGLLQARGKLDALAAKHRNANDFNGSYIIKDRFGGGGYGIFKFDFEERGLGELVKKLKKFAQGKRRVSYIIQPFIDCDKGFTIGEHSGFIDLRMIILNQKIVDSYIRIAAKGSFRNDGVNGGRLVFIPQSSIPKDVVRIAEKIRGIIDEEGIKNHIYALDFIKNSDGNAYLVEGNSRPGITWAFGENSPDMTARDKTINRERNMDLIDMIVSNFKTIIDGKQEAIAA